MKVFYLLIVIIFSTSCFAQEEKSENVWCFLPLWNDSIKPDKKNTLYKPFSIFHSRIKIIPHESELDIVGEAFKYEIFGGLGNGYKYYEYSIIKFKCENYLKMSQIISFCEKDSIESTIDAFQNEENNYREEFSICFFLRKSFMMIINSLEEVIKKKGY